MYRKRRTFRGKPRRRKMTQKRKNQRLNSFRIARGGIRL